MRCFRAGGTCCVGRTNWNFAVSFCSSINYGVDMSMFIIRVEKNPNCQLNCSTWPLYFPGRYPNFCCKMLRSHSWLLSSRLGYWPLWYSHYTSCDLSTSMISYLFVLIYVFLEICLKMLFFRDAVSSFFICCFFQAFLLSSSKYFLLLVQSGNKLLDVWTVLN